MLFRSATIHLFSVVTAITESHGRLATHCQDGTLHEADAAIVTVPLPIVRDISLPDPVHEKVAASADIGFGNVVKILLRFTRKWWTPCGKRDLSGLSFLISGAMVPVWWTQHPSDLPVLTGWFAGPKTDTVARLTVNELVDMGLGSLAEIFNLPPDRITRDLITSQAINWGNDPFARGAYSYATPRTRQAQVAMRKINEAPYSFLAKRCTLAGIWAQSRRRW